MSRRSLADGLRQDARRFDATSLLDLLAERLPDLPILMRSEPSPSPASSLFAGVAVTDEAVTISVNLGMRTATSPLATYFLDLLEDPSVGPGLAALLDVVDAGTLPDRVAAYHKDAGLAGHRSALYALAQRASPASLHWLFQAVFPELEVRASRAMLARSLATEEARVGEATLGEAALGGEAVVPVNGFQVVLHTVQSRSWGNVPWRSECARRMRAHILPALAGTGAYLCILLVEAHGEGRLELGPSGGEMGSLGAEGTYLGYDALVSATSPAVSIVFAGVAPDAART